MSETEHAPLLLIEKVLLLKSLSIFSETPETILAEVAHLMIDMNTEMGEHIVKENEIGNCMYIISEGTVNVYKGTHLLMQLQQHSTSALLMIAKKKGKSKLRSVSAVQAMVLRLVLVIPSR